MEGECWYTARSRFNSQSPWNMPMQPGRSCARLAAGSARTLRRVPKVTPEHLRRFHRRRLEAMEQIAQDFTGNRLTEKTPFHLPDLPLLRPGALPGAGPGRVRDHRAARGAERLEDGGTAPPERRVLIGETLLVRYREEDQPPDVAAQNRENEQRRL